MSASQPSGEPLFASAVLLAGGSGARMQGSVADKILLTLAGQPAILHSVRAFLQSGAVQALVFVYRDDDQRAAIEELLPPTDVSIHWARGGEQRYHSVWSGLQAAPDDTEIVLIHDCARPCVTPEAIRESVEAARRSGAACLAQAVVDTIKQVEPTSGGYRLQTLDRSRLWAMGTPQSFRFALIRDAYEETIAAGRPITDDLAAIEGRDISVVFVDNRRPNPKLTTPADVAYIEAILASGPPETDASP